MESTVKGSSIKKDISVVIVGAGISGLAAAHRLQKYVTHCKFNVKLLEAGPHPGGRIQSVKLHGTPAELGARFLYRYKDFTELTNFAVKKGLTSKLLDNGDELFIEGEMPTVHLMSNGEALPQPVAIHYKKMIDTLLDEVVICAQKDDWSYTIDCCWPKNRSVSSQPNNIQEYLSQRFKVAASATPKISGADDPIPKCIFQRMIAYEQFENGTRNFSDVGINQYKYYTNLQGQFELKGGYQEITDALAQELLPDTIQCNAVVESIKWTPQLLSDDEATSTYPVTVVCKDGSTHTADHVIVTVSLGVLQEHCRDQSPSFFSPPLNKERVEAIMKLGMGKGATILIEFSAPLLDTPHQSIEFFWLEESIIKFEDHKWARNLDILLRVKDSNIYGAWFTGDNASAVEVATKDELTAGIIKVLKTFLQSPVPHPMCIEVSTWIQNPFIRGTYSYYAQGCSECDREQLCEPINGSTPLQLLFAGEATHTTLYATTNGAYGSGVREANRLIDCYQHKNDTCAS